MKISIIIPVYNVSDYIEDCINSIIAQTYQGEIECILVDDCGGDDSMLLASSIISHYRGHITFKIVSHPVNKGLSAARNTGIANSTGDYIFFLDSDDWLSPDCIQRLVYVLQIHPDSDISQGGTRTTDGSFDWLDFEKTIKPEFYDTNDAVGSCLMNTLCVPITATGKLISRHLLNTNNIRFMEGIIHEDELFAYQLAIYVKKVVFCNYNIYNYRIRPNSIMTNAVSQKEYNSWLIILNLMIDYLNDGIKKAQIEKIKDLSNDLYFRYDNPEFRSGIAELKKRLSHVCSFPLSAKLYLWGALAESRFGKSPIVYYWLYQTTRKDPVHIIIKDVLKRSFA